MAFTKHMLSQMQLLHALPTARKRRIGFMSLTHHSVQGRGTGEDITGMEKTTQRGAHKILSFV
jgi:hypothetical protein